MKIKIYHLFIVCLAVISLFVNSCKKDAQTSIQALFTSGTWQLASVKVFHRLGNSNIKVDTLNTDCDKIQLFTFIDNTNCTYTNFHCIDQPIARGTWTVSKDQLFLIANMACTDTLAGGVQTTTVHPFIYARITNLGNYSMVLQTGDIGTYHTPTTKYTYTQYGFVRQKKQGN